jgi:hypothetical protein
MNRAHSKTPLFMTIAYIRRVLHTLLKRLDD